MNRPLTFVLTAAMLISAVSFLPGCTVSIAASGAQSRPKPVQENTVGLLLIRRNNLNQQYRAEVFPIAVYKNGRYQNASVDLTLQVRQNPTEANIVKANAAKSPLKPRQSFTGYDAQRKPIALTVNQLGVGQFACSSLLVGRAIAEQPLKTAFDTISTENTGGLSGYFNRKEVDETWRSTLAVQNPTSAPSPQLPASSRYSQDALNATNTIFQQNSASRNVVGSSTIETIQAVDLDRDGKPEVFATVRKGRDPRTTPPSGSGQPSVRTAYATVWLTYQTNAPKVISSDVVLYNVAESRQPTSFVGTIDVDGDGIDEVIVRNNGYESSTYRIYEYKNNQLRSVFSGAGYGC